MDAFHIVLLFHVLCAAVWFGAGLMVPGDMRRTLARGRPHAEWLVARVDRLAPRIIAAAFLTLLSGGVLVWLSGGLSGVPRRIHVALALTITTFIIGAALASPTWKRIAKLVNDGGDLQEAQRLAARFQLFNHAEHALWLTILGLMVLKF